MSVLIFISVCVFLFYSILAYLYRFDTACTLYYYTLFLYLYNIGYLIVRRGYILNVLGLFAMVAFILFLSYPTIFSPLLYSWLLGWLSGLLLYVNASGTSSVHRMDAFSGYVDG